MPSTESERRDALPIGTVLRDFTIQAVIGHGGFGIVYRAAHNELELTVAIKEYLPVELAVREGATVQPRSGTDRRDFDDGLRRFRDEAQALIDFDSHPSIVSCRDFFRAHGTAYLVMAYEDGQSLAELLANREAEGRPFAESDLLAVMAPLLEGLARVHAAGVLHRDIKPSNILIRRHDGRPVLIDFGAAKQATARFSKSQAPYTEGYAALEQVADTGKLGPWTDMYGVGAVMWRMVAGGNRPWEPPHPLRVELRSHAALGEMEDPMPAASDLGAGRFPAQLLEVVDQCLQLRENKRIQGSHELLEAFRMASAKSLTAESAELARPQSKRIRANRQDGRLDAAPAIRKPRAGWTRVGWLVLASLAVGLGLVIATRWSPSSDGTARNQGTAGASVRSSSEVASTGDGEALDVEASRSGRPPIHESLSEAQSTIQSPDEPSDGSGPNGEDSKPEIGRGSDDSLDMRPQSSQADVAQPWIRGWDALDDIDDPDFAATAQAYIEKYKQVPEASVWVAQAEGLLAKLKALESASPSQRPSNRESLPQANDAAKVSELNGTGSSRTDEPSETETGRGNVDSIKAQPQLPDRDAAQPWIRDWDAIGDVRDPGFAETAQAYIARYGKVAEASVWVARAEGQLAELRALESADRPPREVDRAWRNSLGMEFVWVPAGNFLMGSPTDEEGRDSDERQHEVRISEGFWMKRYEVTQGEWKEVLGENPSNFKECGPRCPIEQVSWDDAQEYVRRLNGRESGMGFRYRLPTEAEWEYAARAGTAGPRYGELDEVAWHSGNSDQPHPVGQKQSNGWGLHDMLGNVWEWTADRYGRYPAGPVKDPRGPRRGTRWVTRGGGWNYRAGFVRSANRRNIAPGYRNSDIGFRLIRTK